MIPRFQPSQHIPIRPLISQQLHKLPRLVFPHPLRVPNNSTPINDSDLRLRNVLSTKIFEIDYCGVVGLFVGVVGAIVGGHLFVVHL